MVVFVGIRSTNKNHVGAYMLLALVLLAAAEWAFGISGRFSEALGRGSHLSGRTVLWARLLEECTTNPILGTGSCKLLGSGDKATSSWKEFSGSSRTRLITAIWKLTWNWGQLGYSFHNWISLL